MDEVLSSKNILERFSLKDRSALVTGGAQGIGRALAHALADAGAAVVVEGGVVLGGRQPEVVGALLPVSDDGAVHLGRVNEVVAGVEAEEGEVVELPAEAEGAFNGVLAAVVATYL